MICSQHHQYYKIAQTPGGNILSLQAAIDALCAMWQQNGGSKQEWDNFYSTVVRGLEPLPLSENEIRNIRQVVLALRAAAAKQDANAVSVHIFKRASLVWKQCQTDLVQHQLLSLKAHGLQQALEVFQIIPVQDQVSALVTNQPENPWSLPRLAGLRHAEEHKGRIKVSLLPGKFFACLIANRSESICRERRVQR